MPTPEYIQVTPHIFKLDLPFRPIPGVNLPVGVWLVHGADGWILVDSGAPDFEKTVLEQTLKQTGGQKPTWHVLTHGHLDHAGVSERIYRDWKVPLAAGRDEIPYVVGPRHYNEIPGPLLYRLAQLSPIPLIGRNVQLPLDEGMRVGDLEVYHVPGHAPGMVALLHPGDRALICGDAFANLKNKLSDPLAMFTYDMDLNHRSQAKLAELDFDHLLVSHGPPIMQHGRSAAQGWVKSRAKKS